MKHRMITAMLAAAVFTGSCAVLPAGLNTPVSAAENALSGTCGDDLTWTYDKDTAVLTVSGTGNMENYSYGSAGWYAYRKDIEVLRLENGITGIGDMAFMSFERLAEVTIPESVKKIGWNAFSDCGNLTKISIPETVTEIGGFAFDATAWLDAKRTEDPRVVVNGILIDARACSGAVTVPDGVKTIGSCAFRSAENVTTVTVPDGVETILHSVFSDCRNLAEVTVAESVKYIGIAPFYGTAWLKAKKAEDPLVSVNQFLVDGTACSGDVVIPDGITQICGCAFENCTGLVSIVLPEGMECIDDRAFTGCSHLTTVSIPDGVKTIGNRAFEGCGSRFTGITIPESVENIGENAFYANDADFTIYGIFGSYAETYAHENEIRFVGTESSHPEKTIPGDVNGDGKVNSADAVLLQKWLLGTPETALPDLSAGDLDQDGKLTAVDLTLLKRKMINV